MKIIKKPLGFTYIEILIAVVILAFILIPLLNQFYIGFIGNKAGETITQAANLAEDLMDEIKSKRFDEKNFPAPTTDPAALGLDSGEAHANRSKYDDVDDYHNLTQSPALNISGTPITGFDRFARNVRVEYVSLNASSRWVSSSTLTNYKRIAVTVTHPEIADTVLETIVSYY